MDERTPKHRDKLTVGSSDIVDIAAAVGAFEATTQGGRTLVLEGVPSPPKVIRKDFKAFDPKSIIDRILKKKGLLWSEWDDTPEARQKHLADARQQKNEGGLGTASESDASALPPAAVLSNVSQSSRFQLQIFDLNLSSNVGKGLLSKLPVTLLVAIELRGTSLLNVDMLEACPRLRFLGLAENRLEALPKLGHMKSLQFLDLSSNSVASLKGVSRKSMPQFLPPSLVYLSLLGNPVAKNNTHRDVFVVPTLPRLLGIDRHILCDEETLRSLHPAPFCAGHPNMRIAPPSYPLPPQHAQQGAATSWTLDAMEAHISGLARRLERHYRCTNPVPIIQKCLLRAVARLRLRLGVRLAPHIAKLIRLQALVRRFLLRRRTVKEYHSVLLEGGVAKEDLIGPSGNSSGGGGSSSRNGGDGEDSSASLRLNYFATVLGRWWHSLADFRHKLRCIRCIQRNWKHVAFRRRSDAQFLVQRGYEGIVVPETYLTEVLYTALHALHIPETAVLAEDISHVRRFRVLPPAGFSQQPQPQPQPQTQPQPQPQPRLLLRSPRPYSPLPFTFLYSSFLFLQRLDNNQNAPSAATETAHSVFVGRRRSQYSLWYCLQNASNHAAQLSVIRRRGCCISPFSSQPQQRPRITLSRFHNRSSGLARIRVLDGNPQTLLLLVRTLRRVRYYNPDSVGNSGRRLQMPIWYDGHVLQNAAAAAIQRVVRGVGARRHWKDILLSRLMRRRAAVCLQRLWRGYCGLKRRFALHRLISTFTGRIAASQKPEFFLDLWVYYALLRWRGPRAWSCGRGAAAAAAGSPLASLGCYPEFHPGVGSSVVRGRTVTVAGAGAGAGTGAGAGATGRHGCPRWAPWAPPVVSISALAGSGAGSGAGAGAGSGAAMTGSHNNHGHLTISPAAGLPAEVNPTDPLYPAVELLTCCVSVRVVSFLLPVVAATVTGPTGPSHTSLIESTPQHRPEQCLRMVCLGFSSMQEAKRRAAQLMLLTYDPRSWAGVEPLSATMLSQRLGEYARRRMESRRSRGQSQELAQEQEQVQLRVLQPPASAPAPSSFLLAPAEMTAHISLLPRWLRSQQAAGVHGDIRDVIRLRYLVEALGRRVSRARDAIAEGGFWLFSKATDGVGVSDAEQQPNVFLTQERGNELVQGEGLGLLGRGLGLEVPSVDDSLSVATMILERGLEAKTEAEVEVSMAMSISIRGVQSVHAADSGEGRGGVQGRGGWTSLGFANQMLELATSP